MKLSAVVMSAALVVTGCAGIGDTEVSLLPRSKLTDPLEVPPGLSPLPEPEQFVVPDRATPANTDVRALGPEQLRAYSLWLEFEEFKKYQSQVKGENLTEEEYQVAKLSGEGLFRIGTVEDAEAEFIRLQVHDNVESVWEMLPSALADMSVFVLETDNEARTLLVTNTGVKQRITLMERLRFRKFSGGVDKIQVRAISGGRTEILGLSDLDVEVNPKAGREFFERLRFYLLARYDAEEKADTSSVQALLSKQLVTDSDGVQKIVLAESFDTTWVRVGRTLQGAGAAIQDMNRSEGIYYISFAESAKQRKKKKRWQFWKRKEVNVPEQLQYQVFISGKGDETVISVIDIGDQTEEDFDPEAAQKILLIIYERLSA